MVSNLAKRCKVYVQSPLEKEQMQDEEREHQERRLDVINHVTQLQLDVEASGVPRAPPGPTDPAPGVARTEPGPEVVPADPTLMRLEEDSDGEHFLATFERLVPVYDWPALPLCLQSSQMSYQQATLVLYQTI